MKKLFAWILTLAMLFSLAACGGQTDTGTTREMPEERSEPENTPDTAVEEQSVELAEEQELPAVGDVVEGFAVKEVRDFPLVGGQLVFFEHEKTGAGLLYIANSDTDRVFDLTFFTRAIDNTGLPHVFEHSTLDGSEKYPSKSLFFNLSYQTYNTYMNAQTQALLTTYPVASLSEAQLLKYADYYTDSCLHPMVLEDESIFREEAWRYRMNTPEDPLTIEGTVYSEMLGVMDLTSTAYMNAYRCAFPGSVIGNEHGGLPENIPEMTFESLRAYHDLYYHPSNCIAYLYGSFEDYTAFLRLLDEAFSPYEKREFSFEDTDYEPLQESVAASFAFPVETGSNTENTSAVFYAFLCPGLSEDPEEETLMNTLTDLLGADASPLMQKLRTVLPQGDFGSYIEIDAPDDAIVFYGFDLNPDDADTFRATVDEVLKELAEKDFSEELVDSVSANLLMTLRLLPEQSGYGVEIIENLASYYASSGDPFGFTAYVDGMEKIGDWYSEGRYREAISDWLLEDAVTATTLTYPEAGLREKLDAAEAERLADVKAAMSEEEIQAIVAASNAEETEDDAAQFVAQLQAETVETLPEEIRSFPYTDVIGDDGVRRIDVTAEVDGVGQTGLFFDASGIAQEDLHWFSLYTSLVGNLDTAETDRETLAVRTTRLLYGCDIRLSLAEDRENGGFIPRLRAGWLSAEEDLAAGYDLMYEVLFETDFSDADTVLGLISREKASLKSSIVSAPYSTMLNRALGYYAPLYRYYSYINGLEYYAFLEQAEQLAASDPAQVAAKLQSVQEYFRNRTNAVAVYVGSEDGIALNADLVDGFMARLDTKPVVPVEYDLPAPAANEALVVDSTVQYNGMVSDYATLGLENFSGEMDAVSALLSDAYLYPSLRDGYGAYGVMASFIEDYGIYMVSYRDPNIAETFAVYEAMPAFIENLEVTQEDLDGYILSAYSNYAMPEGELSGGMTTALNVLTGDPVDADLQYMRDLKTLTPELFADYGAVCAKLTEDGVRFTAGGAAAIAAEADRYDVILNPFGAEDLTAIALQDVPEDHPQYEAVRFVFENGLMLPLEEENFGVDEPATVGDFSAALYLLVGGESHAPEEAVEFLQSYGIVSAALTPDTELSGSDADEILSNFSEAVADETAPDPITIEGIITRGELAEILMSYLG